MGETLTPSLDAVPWQLKASVGTWLIPIHAKEEDVGEAALKAFDSSVPVDPDPKAANVAKVQSKGLYAKVKSLFCCVQSPAAEPRSLKAPTAPKAPKARKSPKASKTSAKAKA